MQTEKPASNAIALPATVAVTELSGSESYVHFDFCGQAWVALLHGIREFARDEQVQFWVQPEHVMLFDANQQRIALAAN